MAELVGEACLTLRKGSSVSPNLCVAKLEFGGRFPASKHASTDALMLCRDATVNHAVLLVGYGHDATEFRQQLWVRRCV